MSDTLALFLGHLLTVPLKFSTALGIDGSNLGKSSQMKQYITLTLFAAVTMEALTPVRFLGGTVSLAIWYICLDRFPLPGAKTLS